MLFRILLLSALIVLAGWAIGQTLRKLRGPDSGGQALRKRPQAPAAPAIVACANCGLHLPQAEAIPEGTHWYCSAAHRDAGPATPR